MTHPFDSYDSTYREVVQSSIDFSRLPHRFFMTAKADLLRDLIEIWFGPAARPAALDVGCGIGVFHPFVRHLFGSLSGTDISADCIERARRDNPGIEYRIGAGSSLPFRDAEFDLTIAVCVLHHVAPAGRPRFLHEVRRVTRPGGVVCVVEHNPLNPLTRLSVARCEFDRDAVLLGSRRTERLMADAGLGNIASRYFLLLPSAGSLARRIERWFPHVPLGAQYLSHAQVRAP